MSNFAISSNQLRNSFYLILIVKLHGCLGTLGDSMSPDGRRHLAQGPDFPGVWPEDDSMGAQRLLHRELHVAKLEQGLEG